MPHRASMFALRHHDKLACLFNKGSRPKVTNILASRGLKGKVDRSNGVTNSLMESILVYE